MAGSFAPVTSGTAALNNILTQEANRIGQDIYQQTLHQSAWVDLIKKGTFPDGMGYQLNTLIYDRALPQNDGANTGTFDALGLNWAGVASSSLTADNTALNTSALIEGSSIDRTGPRNKSARIDFTKKLKGYNLQRASVESPRINVDDLRFAAYRTEQLSAIMEIMRTSTHRSWEERNRDEFDRLAGNIVVCKSDASVYTTTVEGTPTLGASGSGAFFDADVDSGSDGADDANAKVPTAFISNKVLDTIYMKQVRAGAGQKPYGRENMRPIFGLVLSSEASYALQTEPGFRDDIRYNSAKVSDLIAPLGVEKAFRGYYHLVDDLSPRADFDGTTDKILRVYPEVYSSGVLIPNTSYDSAAYELAYVLHEEVMESLIPGPVSAGAGMSFNPVNYRGDFKWLNIPDEVINPDGTIGFFRGVLASASKPIKTNYGWVIAFKRTSTTPAL